MNTPRNDKLILVLSQISAWGLLFLLFFFPRLIILFIFPVINNVPAALTISMWLIQMLVITNFIAIMANLAWNKDEVTNKAIVKKRYISLIVTHLIVSVSHVFVVYVSIFILSGGEDL